MKHLAQAALVAAVLVPVSSLAAPLSKEQAKCTTALSKGGAGVVRAGTGLIGGCIVADAGGKVDGVQACVVADAKGKAAKAVAKTVGAGGKLCQGPAEPAFAARSASVVNNVATAGTAAFAGDLLALPLPDAVEDEEADGCRAAMFSSASKRLVATLAAFGKCKQAALATADDAGDLASCLDAASSDAKVAKAAAKLASQRASKCPDLVVASALPGMCSATVGTLVDDCVDARAACRACEILAASEDLPLDCDSFDDGASNGSCYDGSSSTTTTTTSTTTSTTTTSTTSTTTSTLPHPDCRALQLAEGTAVSGVYTLSLDGGATTYEAFCDMTTDGGGWTVIQRRFDGSTSFARSWAEYAAGFGAATGEYWLGNDRIHALTSPGARELHVKINDGMVDGFARWSSFTIANAAGLYTLSVSGYTGDIGDALGDTVHNGRPFSTYDSDNDVWVGNCSTDYGSSGWWFGACHISNLNGTWYTPGAIGDYAQGLSWYPWKGYFWSMASSTMMVR